jgi:bacteriorhodopsin
MTHPIIVLSVAACAQFGIFALNSIKSYQISTFKIDRLSAFINSIIPLVPVINYITILISYDEAHPSLVAFFIEWSVVIPLLLTNIGRLLHFNIIEYAMVCFAAVAMTLTGYASASAEATEMMFALFGVSGACYVFIILFLSVSYCRRKKQSLQETNFPTQLTQNNLTVFKWIFCIVGTTWNGYPIIFLLWKTQTISVEHTIIGYVCLDLLTKGLCVLILLAYKLMLYRQNGYLVRGFRHIIKVHPILNLEIAN